MRRGVSEGPVPAALPEVDEDDDAGDCRVRTPDRRERVLLDSVDDQKDYEIGDTENDHSPNLREKQGAAGGDHIQDRDDYVTRSLIGVDDAVLPDEDFSWKGGQGPQNIECCRPSDDEEGDHAGTTGAVRFEEENGEGQEEREKSLGIEHVGGAHIVGNGWREASVQSEPDKSLNELMDGEEQGQRCEKQFAPMLDPCEGDNAEGSENSTADKVGCR